MTMTQFITCKFRPEDSRTYTYRNEGDPVFPGDMVKVADARSDSWKRVTVVDVNLPEPSFATKPIFGLLTPEEAAA
jgi:hypothetical protein